MHYFHSAAIQAQHCHFFLFLGRYLHTVIKRDQKNDDVVLYGFIDPGATFTFNKEFESYVVNR